MISAQSLATSDPEPMHIPQLEILRAVESLVPSPVTVTMWPIFCKILTINILCEGVALAKKFEILKNEVKNELKNEVKNEVKNELKNELKNEVSDKVLEENKHTNLEYLIQNSKTTWQETEWEFPKGHRNFQEKDVETALREFEEETGYSKDNITIIDNIIPYEEIFIGSNHKSYKHKYYVAYLNTDTDTMQNYQQTEVSKIEWKTIDECLSSIRPYNLEKKTIIKNVNQVLLNYILSY